MFDSIDSAIGAIRRGELVIVVDDEHRENEGDFVCSAAMVTPEIVNFMTKYGRGLICASLPDSRCDELQLPLMVNNNTSLHETAFTISVDLLDYGCSTGISAYDRAMTLNALNHPKTTSVMLGRPGHIFPLRSQKGGVLQRSGHTEAGTDLVRLAGFPYPQGAVLVEIMCEDGSMARVPDLIELAQRFDLKLILIKDLKAYRLRYDSLMNEIVRIDIPTSAGDFVLCGFQDQISLKEHLALIKVGEDERTPVLLKLYFSSFTLDFMNSVSTNRESQLHNAMELIQREGQGVIIIINQKMAGFDLLNKIKVDQSHGDKLDCLNTAQFQDVNNVEGDIEIAVQILNKLNIRKIQLMKCDLSFKADLSRYGFEVNVHSPSCEVVD